MKNVQHEDAIMKMAMEYFKNTLLKTLGIDYNYVDTGPTELVSLTIEKLYQDFTFLTDQDFYIHLEFQTTDGADIDLRRFHVYEAAFCHRTGKKVLTYVIYTNGIENVREILDCGLYTYRIKAVYLTDKNADTVLKRIAVKNGQALSEDDFADIALTPVMYSERSRKDVIKQAILLVKPFESVSAQKVLAMLYAFADKFLNHDELKEIKEAVAMTRIGQMIFEDGEKAGLKAGMEAGEKAGMNAGISANVIKLLLRKGVVSEEIRLKIKEEKDTEKLSEWFDAALDAECVEDFVQKAGL